MFNQLFNLPDMSRADLEARTEELHSASDFAHNPENVALYNMMHEDLAEYNRRDLVTKYNITLDDFGKYQLTHDDAHRLIYDTLLATLDAATDTARYIRGFGGLSDDGLDYLGSIADQLTTLQNWLVNGTDDLPGMLDLTRDQADEDDRAMAFIYGYADHGTPISDLMRANYDTLD